MDHRNVSARSVSRRVRAAVLLTATLALALPLAVAQPGDGPGPQPAPAPGPEHKDPGPKVRAECWKLFVEDLQSCLATFGPGGVSHDEDAKLACFDGALASFNACIK